MAPVVIQVAVPNGDAEALLARVADRLEAVNAAATGVLFDVLTRMRAVDAEIGDGADLLTPELWLTVRRQYERDVLSAFASAHRDRGDHRGEARAALVSLAAHTLLQIAALDRSIVLHEPTADERLGRIRLVEMAAGHE